MADSNNIITGAAQVSIAGSNVGFTQGGVEVRYEPEFIDIMADQAVGVVAKRRASERMYVKTTLLEVTLTQIRLAFMQPSSQLVGGNTLTLGYGNACWVEEVEIVLVGKGPNCGTRTFTFPKCVTFGQRTYSMQRDAPVAFETEFEILKDADGHFGTIVDS